MRGSPKKRRKRYSAYDSRAHLAGESHISKRPASFEAHREIGHWEADTVMGSGDKHSILILVERKTGYVKTGKLANRTKDETKVRAIRLINKHPYRIKTTTSDHGTEFQQLPGN